MHFNDPNCPSDPNDPKNPANWVINLRFLVDVLEKKVRDLRSLDPGNFTDDTQRGFHDGQIAALSDALIHIKKEMSLIHKTNAGYQSNTDILNDPTAPFLWTIDVHNLVHELHEDAEKVQCTNPTAPYDVGYKNGQLAEYEIIQTSIHNEIYSSVNDNNIT